MELNPYGNSPTCLRYAASKPHVFFHIGNTLARVVCFTCEFLPCKISHVAFNMWKFICVISQGKISNVIFTCDFSHVKIHMWNITRENLQCEISYVTFTCEKSYMTYYGNIYVTSYVKILVWNFAYEFSQLKSHGGRSHRSKFLCDFPHFSHLRFPI